MLLLAMAGWINRYQQAKLEFCLEQIRIYKQLHGGKPLRLNDDQRRRLAAKGKELGLSGLREARDARHTGDDHALASRTDRTEVRRQRDAASWTTSNRR